MATTKIRTPWADWLCKTSVETRDTATGAAALLRELPDADWLIADRGYDADWFRDALKDREITPCVSARKARKVSVKYDKRRYKRRNRIEIMFGRFKDWRRIAKRYDRCPKVLLSASTHVLTARRNSPLLALNLNEPGA